MAGTAFRVGGECMLSSLFYANSEPQPNAKYSCAASVAIARSASSVLSLA